MSEILIISKMFNSYTKYSELPLQSVSRPDLHNNLHQRLAVSEPCIPNDPSPSGKVVSFSVGTVERSSEAGIEPPAVLINSTIN